LQLDLQGDDAGYFDIHVRPSSYVEKLVNSGSKEENKKMKYRKFIKPDETDSKNSEETYVFRIYLTEPAGCVLGSNFMNDHNIIFDPDGMKVGIVPSSCEFIKAEERLLLSTTAQSIDTIPVKNRRQTSSSYAINGVSSFSIRYISNFRDIWQFYTWLWIFIFSLFLIFLLRTRHERLKI
jgi:hypothetical protein